MTGYLFAIGSAILYGSMPLLAKGIYACGGTELTVVSLRFLLAAPLVYLIVRLRRISLAITAAELGKLLLLAQGYMFTTMLLCFSYSYISAGMSTTIHFIYPTLVLLICVIVFRERLGWVKALCAVLGLVGVTCFYTPGERASGAGMLLAFCSAWTYAFYVVYDEKSGMAKLNPYKLCFYISVICGLESLGIALFRGEFVMALPLRAWGLVAILAFGVTMFAIVLAQGSLKCIGAAKTSFLSTFEPLTSVILGIVLLGEALTVRTGVGIVCILASALLLAAAR